LRISLGPIEKNTCDQSVENFELGRKN